LVVKDLVCHPFKKNGSQTFSQNSPLESSLFVDGNYSRGVTRCQEISENLWKKIS